MNYSLDIRDEDGNLLCSFSRINDLNIGLVLAKEYIASYNLRNSDVIIYQNENIVDIITSYSLNNI